MIDRVEIKSKLREFITDNFLIGTDIESISDTDSFMEKEIIDSNGVLELTAFIETEFSIGIEDDELTPENLDSIEKLTNFIFRKKT